MPGTEKLELKERVLLKKINTFILSTLLLGCICFITVLAKEYRVSNTQQVLQATSSIQPGDTILMLNGTWTNSKIVFSANGTKDKNIYMRAEQPGKVVLNGTSSLRIAGNYLVVEGLFFKDGYSESGDVIEFRNGSLNSNYCRLTNCAIVNYNPSDKNKDYKWVSLYGTNNRVDHCYIRDKNHSGTTLVVWLSDKPNYHLIDHNYFARRTYLGYNGAETIRVGTSDWSMYNSYTTVEYNYFEECDGETEIISNKSCENVYRYNTFYKCSGTLTLRHGNRCRVESNFFFGKNKKDTGGIRIIGEDHKVYNNYLSELDGDGYRSAISIVNAIPNSPLNGYWQVKNAIVAFNTLVNNRHSLNIGTDADNSKTLPPVNCTLANNIIVGSQSPLVVFESTPINLLWQSNIFYGASTGITQNPGVIIADPKLYFSQDSLWRLSFASLAIGKAEGSFSYITEDFDGQKRDTIKDIGCDQYSLQENVRHPVSSKDTGPDWLSQISGISSILDENFTRLPEIFKCSQNYPNPFNPSTVIEFVLNEKSLVRLEIYNSEGELIKQLLNEEIGRGSYQVKWNPEGISSGIYYYRLIVNDNMAVKKMCYLK